MVSDQPIRARIENAMPVKKRKISRRIQCDRDIFYPNILCRDTMVDIMMRGMPLRKKIASLLRKPSKPALSRLSLEYVTQLSELQREQKRLSAEIESLFRSYDGVCRHLSERILAFPNSREKKKEIERLSSEQAKIWKCIRRAQASERTREQLEREYLEWVSRVKDCEIPLYHPNHPSIRAEIIASELRVRGFDLPDVTVSSVEFHGSAKDADLANELEDLASLPDEAPSEDSCSTVVGESCVDQENASPWHGEDVDMYIRNVEEAEAELRRLLRRSDAVSFSREIAELATDLRRHHANLRLHDRAHGVRRYRLSGF